MAAQITQLMKSAAKPLPPISDKSFGASFDHFGGYKVVLIGDGSHGTSEFYRARAEITKRLIEHHGFDTVAVEADWPDAEAIDRYVRQRPGVQAHIAGTSKEEPFQRFPTWMWRNIEVQDFVHWMRDYNAQKPKEQRAGFYGLDLYSMGTSIDAVIKYLNHVDPDMARLARQRYGCLQPWVEDPTQYGLASLTGRKATCDEKVVEMLRDLLHKRLEYSAREHDGEEFHSSEQNAYVIADAEAYYRAMYSSSADSWSLRDSHMFETLHRLLKSKPASSKAVVWAHNSHIGDARYTSMGTRRNELNVGQLCRQNLGRQHVALIGCGTHTGTVAAAHEWGDDVEIMNVKPSRPDSWEYLAHKTGIPSFLLELRPKNADQELLHACAQEPDRLERFIGVIYRPQTERVSHYSAAALADQFDSYVWFDRTSAVRRLEKKQPATPLGLDETYPFGL
ncbi:hypothetical protein AJ80_03588 [Polytolypa hystricis UAMH7299]|uniref:Erythromycin esterase n=1 Tax=Polytolypa hystricis (strain UAMH7299) TaxID=1447883 RepID=A0A2B7YHU4_POLH7|nr:hypothetical protein AJ80_03588 [Polytolypa hystricis UAMH7299]